MLHLLFIPSAQALNPTARWGHRAAYVDSKQAMYVVGGSVAGAGTQITNEVLVLPLNSSATWTDGPTSGLPAHAFASMALQDDTLVVVGGMTASCASDGIAHSLDLSNGQWTSASPTSLHRRHGAAAAPIHDGIMVVGGIADTSTCHNSASAYAAADTLPVPVTDSAVSSAKLPSSLTGTNLAVADFALASTSEAVYLAGGQAADGTLVSLDTVGVWTASDGWVAQKLSGEVPAGRLGATLVAHPSLDMLVLHGGSEYDSASGNITPSQMLATLNTKTWEWSQPANIKPASGLAYHTSVVTPSGVMITAFGMGSDGAPTADVHYLDMRSQNAADWEWTKDWSPSLLGQNTPLAAAAPSTKKTNTAAIAAPVVILTVILLPLAMWLWRRHQRNKRKRRLASHFSFSTQEDNGHFNNFNGGRTGNAYPSSSWSSNMRSAIERVFRRGSGAGVGDDGTIASRELVQVSPSELVSSQNEKNWEEIDFGLGRVDQDRREATYTNLPRRGTPRSLSRRDSFQHPGSPEVEPYMPVASTMYDDDAQLIHLDDSPRLGSPRSDGQHRLSPDHEQSPFRDRDSGMSDAAADAATVDDWNALARSMESRPAFRPLSPSATLGSHQHSPEMYTPVSAAPSLPPMEFPSSPMIHGTMSSVRTQRIPSTQRFPSTQRLPSATHQRVPSDSASSTTRHLAGARRPSVAGERRISAGSFNRNRNPNRLSPLRVVNTDDQNQ
ncbi:hypothetical protein CcaverHIS002_0406320 [Cutaneotrichosporon cavernicola]|uniref:Galactose oxidase n=1 Tax=Cutaneotrichosporon cavernicola TaxID=279322 RepID=A0AA48QVY1_9TREE|nr:uncharacterized protein CcaverHIS019_0406350 [Cutaneotrichosporon cavernicola]BEI84028.1 hypothetical protein CcaverHIS002_0406320 [Cutaneotrichosporon cavernicola]BEI91815.1 hypothetical protein CcaverHIS019_0406350 [Cutaneotrichosporon cavernicola]BEI99586.1 hypothetical protein CcaverHIS631_0406290 [Cutaneotrichosporon cavernicola]BEJ07362.1 hypothetical protein CcaverHIS641_0406310 [Cutaneotrichosporon cavernicola]